MSVNTMQGGCGTEQKRLRVLYLGFDVTYINPTQQQYLKSLSQVFDLVIFGPGYVSRDVLDRGVEAFHDAHGPFDAVFSDELSLLRPGMVSEERKQDHKFYYHACRFDPLLIHKGTEFFSFLSKYKGPRIIAILQTDHYSFSKEVEDMVLEIADYFVCWGQEMLIPKDSISPSSVDDKVLNKQIYGRWTDNYYNFVRSRRDNVISTPHFVALEEMCDRPLRRRSADWSIVGADYDSRVIARMQVDGEGLRRTGKMIPYLFALASRAKFHPYNKYWAIDFLNWIFRKAMRDAKYSFTCGSIVRWPIRKFFEIPGNGAVLVAEQCNGWDALGFHHGENAVACDAADILDAHRWLASDPVRAQDIASAGYRLVRDHHSVPARAEQIRQTLVRIHQGRFYGSYWADGRYMFRDAPKAGAGGK